MARFRPFTVARAAVLFRNGRSRRQVTHYFFRRYGRQWKINSPAEMENLLFHRRVSIAPNFAELFEGKTPQQIDRSFKAWTKKALAHAQESRERLAKVKQMPGFEDARLNGIRALEARPEFTEARNRRAAQQLRRLWADPERAKAGRARSRKRMLKRLEDPDYAAQLAKQGREQLQKLWASPAFRRKQRQRMRRLARDPEFARVRNERWDILQHDPVFIQARNERGSALLRRLHQDREFARAHAKRARRRLKKLWANPVWRKKQVELIRHAMTRYWGTIRSGLIAEFDSRGIFSAFDYRLERRISAIRETPQEIALDREEQKRLMDAIGQLDDSEREGVIRVFFEGNAISRAAEQMSLNEADFRQMLQNAFRNMARRLKENV